MSITRDRNDPGYAKPAFYDAAVRAARDATAAARAAGADYDTVRLSARHAAFQVAGLKPVDDSWRERLEKVEP